jgi:hypothetical protein
VHADWSNGSANPYANPLRLMALGKGLPACKNDLETTIAVF